MMHGCVRHYVAIAFAKRIIHSLLQRGVTLGGKEEDNVKAIRPLDVFLAICAR
jgi:hypothetical protein